MNIAQVEIGQFNYPFAGEFKFFPSGPNGVIVRPSILVKITDQDGLSGWGQAVPVPTWSYETVETVLTTLQNYIAPALIGANPNDFSDIHERMNRVIRPGFTTGQPICKAAVDLACYDLASKQSGLTVSQLIGGNSGVSELKLSWTIASPSLGVVEAQLEQGYSRGYRNFNIKVGYPQSPEYDVELIKIVRAFSPEGFLWADGNTGLDEETALRLMPIYADLGVDVIESPLPPNRIRGYQALVRQGALPVFMDEGIISPVELEEFIALKMLDGVTLKVARSGGLWPSIQIVEIAKKHGLQLLGSGLCDPDLSLAASMHLFSWAGIDKPCALNGPQFLTDSLDKHKFTPTNDRAVLPKAPGLGLDLDERADQSLEFVVHGMLV